MVKKPRYRKVKKYFKSSERYRMERNRRKLVLKLVEEGLNQRQIAEKLSVSERTVRRDTAKLKPYYERKVRHQMSLFKKEYCRKLETELADMSLAEQLKYLKGKLVGISKVLKLRKYYHHQIYLSIDLDRAVNGFPEMRLWPQNAPATFRMPLTINFRYIRSKKAIPFSSMTLSYSKG